MSAFEKDGGSIGPSAKVVRRACVSKDCPIGRRNALSVATIAFFVATWPVAGVLVFLWNLVAIILGSFWRFVERRRREGLDDLLPLEYSVTFQFVPILNVLAGAIAGYGVSSIDRQPVIAWAYIAIAATLTFGLSSVFARGVVEHKNGKVPFLFDRDVDCSAALIELRKFLVTPIATWLPHVVDSAAKRGRQYREGEDGRQTRSHWERVIARVHGGSEAIAGAIASLWRGHWLLLMVTFGYSFIVLCVMLANHDSGGRALLVGVVLAGMLGMPVLALRLWLQVCHNHRVWSARERVLKDRNRTRRLSRALRRVATMLDGRRGSTNE